MNARIRALGTGIAGALLAGAAMGFVEALGAYAARRASTERGAH